MNGARPPGWQLPAGVNPALWEYTHNQRLADDEELYFQGHPLLAADLRFVSERFQTPGALVDLGCGTGRLALEFARRGFAVVAVDLSMPMLTRLQRRATAERLMIDIVRANLCRLGCLASGRFDYALAMFSTIGMIRGAAMRRQAIGEIARILRPGGRLILHAHNLWLNLFDRQGRRWLLEQFARYLRGVGELGDRRMTYRGIPGMEVHLYRWGELRRDLRGAGLRIEEVLPIDAVHARVISAPWICHAIRAGGWMVVTRREGA